MSNDKQLRPGDTFLLRAGTEYFLSTVESVTERSLEVTVPAKDYPPPGMKVSMDFHDDDGCTMYHTKVIRGPSAARRSARLSLPASCRRITHREYTRVETNLPARFREMGTVTYHQATILNLSAGGVLLKTDKTQEFQKLLEIELKLPGNPRLTVLGQIVHKAEQLDEKVGRTSLYGCRFVRLDRGDRKTIVQYVRDQRGTEVSLP